MLLPQIDGNGAFLLAEKILSGCAVRCSAPPGHHGIHRGGGISRSCVDSAELVAVTDSRGKGTRSGQSGHLARGDQHGRASPEAKRESQAQLTAVLSLAEAPTSETPAREAQPDRGSAVRDNGAGARPRGPRPACPPRGDPSRHPGRSVPDSILGSREAQRR